MGIRDLLKRVVGKPASTIYPGRLGEFAAWQVGGFIGHELCDHQMFGSDAMLRERWMREKFRLGLFALANELASNVGHGPFLDEQLEGFCAGTITFAIDLGPPFVGISSADGIRAAIEYRNKVSEAESKGGDPIWAVAKHFVTSVYGSARDPRPIVEASADYVSTRAILGNLIDRVLRG